MSILKNPSCDALQCWLTSSAAIWLRKYLWTRWPGSAVARWRLAISTKHSTSRHRVSVLPGIFVTAALDTLSGLFLLGTCYNASKLTLQFVYVNFYVTTENWTIIETLQRNIPGSQSWWCNTLNKVLVADIESWGSEECWRQRLLLTRECGDQSDCAGSTELSSSVVIPTRPQPSPAPSSGSQDTSQDQAAAALAWLLVTAPPHRHLSYVRGNRAVNEISQSCSQSIFREGTSLQLLAPSCWNRLLKKLSHLFTSIQTLWQMGV